MSRHLLMSDLGVAVTAYGAKGDNNGTIGNGTNDATAIQAAINDAQAVGGVVLIPPGRYRISSQPVITNLASRRLTILAYGATLVPDAGVSGPRITGGNTIGGTSIHGLRIKHSANATAAAGFELVQAWHTKLFDCSVDAYGMGAGYAGVLIRSSDPLNQSTGSFWVNLNNFDIRSFEGGSQYSIPHGVLLKGAANAVRITGSTFSNCSYGVRAEAESGDYAIADSLFVEGNTFETVTTGISVHGVQPGATPSTLAGHRYIGNRFEAIPGSCFSFTGVAAVSGPPVMVGNMLGSSTSTYLVNTMNTSGAQYTSLDGKGLTIANTNLLWADGNRVKSINYDAPALIVEGRPNNATAPTGLDVARPDGVGGTNVVIRMGGTNANVTDAEVSNPAGGGIRLTGIKAISGTSTRASNLRGSATFATAATKAVSFTVAESDAAYFVAISKNANEEIWITNKTASGFTLNSSNASSTATVDWILVR